MRPGEKEIGRFWARWAPTHKHSIRRRCGNNLCIPQEMEIKNLRWVLTWHLKETDLARILEGRNAMLVFCLPCVSPRGGDPNATSRGEQQVCSSSKQQQGAVSSKEPDWQHRPRVFSLFNLLCKTVRFEAFLGPVRVSPRKTCKNSCASHDFQSKPKFWQQDC